MICLNFSGPLPTVSKGTHVTIPLVEDLEDDQWEAAVVKQEGNRIKLSVNSPGTAVIGRYQLTVETSCASGQAVSTHDPANDVYMLFNPWCEGTDTFCNTVSSSFPWVRLNNSLLNGKFKWSKTLNKLVNVYRESGVVPTEVLPQIFTDILQILYLLLQKAS